MGTFNEADHPRDDIGRFTFKNGCGSTGNSPVLKGKVEKTDKTSGGGYGGIRGKVGEILDIIVSTVTNPQVIQSALNIAHTVKSAKEQHKLLKRLYENYEHEKKMEDRANILYPTMNNKEKETKPDYDSKVENQIKSETNKYDWRNEQNFKNSINIVFTNEGGFSDDPNDLGGRTNMGITQRTYNDYCKRHGLKETDVKNITKEEATNVYYNDYWKASGADKIENPVGALILFDTSVLHGVGQAKQFYKQSNGNFEKMLQLRKEYYANRVKEKPSQKKYLNGWNNRTDNLYNILKEYNKNSN